MTTQEKSKSEEIEILEIRAGGVVIIKDSSYVTPPSGHEPPLLPQDGKRGPIPRLKSDRPHAI